MYSESGASALATFFYLQSLFDLLLVTAVVHVTGGAQLAVRRALHPRHRRASLLLPVGGGLLVAALGNVLYFADVVSGAGRRTSAPQ